MNADANTADAFAAGQRECRRSDCVDLAARLNTDPDIGWPALLALVKPEPIATVAALRAALDVEQTKAADLRKQVDEMTALGVSIHKNMDRATTHLSARINAILCRAASDAHDAGKSDVAVALAEMAIRLESL